MHKMTYSIFGKLQINSTDTGWKKLENLINENEIEFDETLFEFFENNRKLDYFYIVDHFEDDEYYHTHGNHKFTIVLAGSNDLYEFELECISPYDPETFEDYRGE